MKNLIFILPFAIFAYFLSKKKLVAEKETVLPEIEILGEKYKTNEVVMSGLYAKIYDKFYVDIVGIINTYALSINTKMALSIIMIESSTRSISENNKTIIGDDGNSVGYMQVSLPAIKDVNKKFSKTFSMNDVLKNAYSNLSVGCMYLDMCYNSAKNSNSINPIRLSFKKYNGGNDETDNSKNAMAEKYAEKAYNYFLTFSK